MLIWVFATGRSCCIWEAHMSAKSSQNCFPTSQWLLGMGGCWGFSVPSLAVVPRSLPWHRHNGQEMDFSPSSLLLINTSCIYSSAEFGV